MNKYVIFKIYKYIIMVLQVDMFDLIRREKWMVIEHYEKYGKY